MVATPTSVPSVAGHKIAWPREREIPVQTTSLPEGTVVVSADSHVMETADLWKDRLPARFKDVAPKLYWDENGFSHLEAEGRLLDVPGLNTMLVEGRPGMSDVEERIKDLNAEGVNKDIIFPQRTLSLVGLQDLELRAACMNAYNEWLADYCKPYPDRLYGVGILNWWEPDAARDNLQALRALGYHAMEIPSSPPGVYLQQPRDGTAVGRDRRERLPDFVPHRREHQSRRVWARWAPSRCKASRRSGGCSG